MSRDYPVFSLAMWTLIAGLISHNIQAAEPWEGVLAGMKLVPPKANNSGTPMLLHETNCVSLLLASFKPNPIIKCMVVLPDTTDELYLRHSFKPITLLAPPTLLETISGLTNQTRIRVMFRAPFLLLYTARDFTTATVQVTDAKTWKEIQQTSFPGSCLFDDYDWSRIQPRLQRALKLKVSPDFNSVDSYHFYRHTLAGYNLTGPELIEALALTGKTKVVVAKKSLTFELDQRVPR